MKSVVPSALKNHLPQIDWRLLAEQFREWLNSGSNGSDDFDTQILKIKELVEEQLRGQYVRRN
jgi:hypothetical protein